MKMKTIKQIKNSSKVKDRIQIKYKINNERNPIKINNIKNKKKNNSSNNISINNKKVPKKISNSTNNIITIIATTATTLIMAKWKMKMKKIMI